MAELLQLSFTPEPWLTLAAVAAAFWLLGKQLSPPHLSRGWRMAGKGWAVFIVGIAVLAALFGLLALGPLFLLPRVTWEGIAQSLVTLWLTPAAFLLAAWVMLSDLSTDQRIGWAGWLAAGVSLLGFVILNDWLVDATRDGTMLFVWAGALLGAGLANVRLKHFHRSG